MGFNILLYTYSKAFGINPLEAQHTPIKMMMEMLAIHGEMEMHKGDMIERAARGQLHG